MVAGGAATAVTAPATAWEKNYGDSSLDEWGESVWQTSDDGFIIAAKAQTGTSALYETMLLKTDWQGNQQWKKTYPGSGVPAFVRQTSDGGYIVTGVSGGNLYALKTDENGAETWSQTYPRMNKLTVEGFSIYELPDGNYIVGGNVGVDNNADMYLAKIDGSGNMLWQKNYNVDATQKSLDRCYSVWPTSDGGFILGGSTIDKTDGIKYVTVLLKTDADGNQQWIKVFTQINGRADGSSMDVQQTRDGGYVLSGINGGKMMLVKADAGGNYQWHKIYDPYGEVYSVQQTWDDGYVFTGGRAAFPNVTIVTRTDSQGNELWQKNLKGTGISFSPSVQQIGNGSYVVAGMTETDAKALTDVYLAQLDKDMTPVPKAKLVSDSIPYIMEAGKTYQVQMTFENTGTMPWTYQDDTTFGHHGDAAKFGVTGANQTIRIGKVVRPGQSETFSFTMTAPAENGTYNPRFQMMWEGHGAFGTLDNETIWVMNGSGTNVTPPMTAPATAVEIGAMAPQATAAGVPTQAQATTEPTAAAPTSSGKGGLPCLSSVVLPLLAIGVAMVSLYQRRKGDD